jgi:hypothetical protein
MFVGADAVRDWIAGVIGNASTPSSPGGHERHDGITTVYYRNSDSAAPIELCTGGVCGSGWGRTDFGQLFGAQPVKGLISTYIRSDSASAFVWRGNDNNIWHATLTSNWSIDPVTGVGHAGLPGGATGDPSAYVRSDLVSAIAFTTSDGHIHEASFGGSPPDWHDGDVTNAAGGLSKAPAGSNPVGYIRADGVTAIVYLSGTKIIELALVPISPISPEAFMCSVGTNSWLATNITDLLGSAVGGTAPPPAASPPRPYTRSDGVSAIVYRSTSNHIIQLSFGAYGWIQRDLTGATGDASSAPVPYVREDGANGVLFADTSGNLTTFELPPFNTFPEVWIRTNLTTTTGSVVPASFNGAPIGSAFLRADGSTEVVFQGANKHVFGIKHGPTGWQKDTSNSSTGDLTPGGA